MAEPATENVEILCHFDGDNESTTFIDSSLYAHIITAGDYAKLDTAIKKFGSASMVGGVATVVHTRQPEDNPWCFECFIYISNLTSSVLVWSLGPSLAVLTSGKIIISFYDGDLGWVDYTGSSTLLLDTQYHIAYTYDGLYIRVFVDGVIELSEVANIYDTSTVRQISTNTYVDYIHIDELRFVIGEAVYTSDFTPPTVAFGEEGGSFDEFWTEERLAVEQSYDY